MSEIWKDVKGYEGIYQVSNLGRVKSLARKGIGCSCKDRILKPHNDTTGYLFTILSFHNEEKALRIHRLVSEAFIPNPEGKLQVNHIDGNKKNNRVENLEWCTSRENNLHAISHGLRCKDYKGRKKLSKSDVDWIRLHCVKGDKEYGRKALAKKFNVTHKTIRDIVTYQTWKEE